MKTGKTLEIKVKDPDFEGLSHITLSNHLALSTFNLYPAINPIHIPNIINNIGEVSEDEFQEAINKIIVYMAKDHLEGTTIDLDYRNECYAPAKEMTITEIEKKLGHKIKIVKEQED